MNIKYFILISLSLGACSQQPHMTNYAPLPDKCLTVAVDSMDSGILLNPIDFISTSHYLIVANLKKDTIFDVFDNKSMKYLYSDLVTGQGPDDMLALRGIRYWEADKFYTSGFGIPSYTMVDVKEKMRVDEKKTIEWKEDVCQNLCLLTEKDVLLQPTKESGEWILYDTAKKHATPIAPCPFPDIATDKNDFISTFQKKAATLVVKNDRSRFALFYKSFPYMRIFDSSGKIIAEKSVGIPYEEIENELSKNASHFGRCAQTDKLIYIKYQPSGIKSDSETHLQVWDWEGNLLYLLKIPTEIHAFTVTPDGTSLFGIKAESDYIYRCSLIGTD